MKKIITILCVAALLLSLVACGGKETKVELTTENISDYLNIEADVTKSTLDVSGKGVFSTGNGNAEITIKSEAISESIFEDVTITCKVTTFGEESYPYGWEFTSDNERGVLDSENYKMITIDIPKDGNISIIEELNFVLYADKGYSPIPAKELDSISFKVVEITGNVNTK